MWALLSSRLRTWLLVAIAVPLARAIVHRLSVNADQRNPHAGTSKLIRRADATLAATRRGAGRRT